jgi:hypothetical protein
MQNLYKCTEGVVAKLSQRRQSKQLQTMISGCRLDRNRNRNKFINQIRAPGGHIQITNMIDTQYQVILTNKITITRFFPREIGS